VFEAILLIVAPAAAVAPMVMLIAWRPWRTHESPPRGEWGAPLGLGLAFLGAYIAGFLVLHRTWPSWLPRERWQLLTMMSLSATCFGLICAGWRPRLGGLIFLCALAAFCQAWFLRPTIPEQHPTALRAALALTAFALAFGLEALARRHPGPLMPLIMFVPFAGATLLFIESGFARIGLLAGAIALALVITAVPAWWNRSISFADGGMIWLGAMLASLLAVGADHGYNTGEAPLMSFVLLAASPLMVWLAETKHVARLRPWQAALARFALVLAPVIAALALVWPIELPPI